ncbi:hypothetical protein C8R44DRAFT_645642, partial [Mycena epipterygia]
MDLHRLRTIALRDRLLLLRLRDQTAVEAEEAGGGGDGASRHYPYIAPGAPYGTEVPTIKPEVKIEQLPSWDGSHRTAVDYFWDIGQFASLEGWMPEALAYWLPSRLEKGSAVQMWFSTLASARQKEMCSHYMAYLRVIKESFLGKKWQLEMNLEFENQSFRQEGHERESPQKFLGRRIRMVRMLANSDDGGPLEVYLVMRRAPIIWSTILVLENIHSSEELYSKVNDHQAALVAAVRKESGEVLTLNNLAASLRKLGYSQNPITASRRANLTNTDLEADIEEESKPTEGNLSVNSDPSDGAETIRQVYQTLKRRQRPPPKGGYPFPKNDHDISVACGNPSPPSITPSSRAAYAVQIEEVEDEYWETQGRMPKAKRHVLELVGEEDGEALEVKEEAYTHAEVEERESSTTEDLDPPPKELDPIFLRAKRSPDPGDSAIGVSVLAVKGWVDSLENAPVNLRLDSCADITLISEEYYSSLRNPPPIKEGHRMSLAQLTDQGTIIKGYSKLRIYLLTTEGNLICTEAEAYVVKGMSVPILLGEDFQLNYELGVSQNVETGTKILFRNTPYEVDATGIEPFPGRSEVHAIATGLNTHARQIGRARAHRRAKARRRRRVLRNGKEGRTIRAATDYLIKPHECKVVRVEGDFREDKEWLVEMKLLPGSEDSFFAVANTLISARRPMVPVSNLSIKPRFARKGEIVGELVDPEAYFDTPHTAEDLERLRKKTALITA